LGSLYSSQKTGAESMLFWVREYEKTQAEIKLMAELSKGEQSAREKGWRTADEVEARLGVAP